MIAHVFRRGRWYSGKLQLPWETKVRVVALETTDRREAQRALDERIKEAFMEHRGELSPRAMREAAERPILELLDLFLGDLGAKGRAEGTVAKYRSNITTLAAGCGWKDLRGVSARSFCEWRKGSELAPKSKNDLLANMSGFCRWLVRQGMLRENPLVGVERADTRLVERCRRALSIEEQRRLLAVSPHFRSVVYLLVLETGIRRNELNNVRVGNFVLETPAPFVRLPASISKNRREANMRLRPHVVAAVRSVFPDSPLPSEYVFRHRVPRVSTIVRDLRRAGIAFKTSEGRMDLHGLRVTFCTNLLAAGVHPRVAQELMRHSDVKLTMRNYTDPSQLPIVPALESLPVFAPSEIDRQRAHEVTLRKLTGGTVGACTSFCTSEARPTVPAGAQPVPAVHPGQILQSG